MLEIGIETVKNRIPGNDWKNILTLSRDNSRSTNRKQEVQWYCDTFPQRGVQLTE